MRKLSFLLLMGLCSSLGLAQDIQLSGSLKTDTSEFPMGQFIIYSLPDSALIKGGYIDSLYFETVFDGSKGHEYYIKISLTGYQDTLIWFEKNSETINLGEIDLSAGRELQTVEIVYRKPEFQRTLDGITVNVQGTTLQTLNTLFDILIASPKLTSPDGEKIEIIGRGTPLILIDRQPIITVDELRAVPASMVESVQIITNPSAKYKAQGSANGVIEVFTKNFALEGYNMNVSTSGGINTQLMPTAGLNLGLNVKRQKFSMNGYLGASLNTSYSEGLSEASSVSDSKLLYSSPFDTKNQNTWSYYQLKAAYKISDSQKLTAGFRGNTSFSTSDANSLTSYFQNGTTITNTTSSGDARYIWMSNSGFINYQIETDTNESYLEVNLNLVQKKGNSSGTSINEYYNFISLDSSEFSLRTESRDQPLIGELRLNYEHNFDTSGWQLRTGLTYSELLNKKAYNRFNKTGDEWIEDQIFTNSYDYKEHLGTAYVEISKDWKKTGFRIGLTAEYTGLEGYSNSLQKQFIDSLYILPFPSASILYQPTENIGLTLSYSSGIDRPQFSDYDPFIRFEDSLNISYGNPYLRPSVSHSFSFDLELFYAYSISFWYDHTADPISEISFFNDSTFLTETTPWNALYDRSIGTDLSIPIQLDWLQGWNSMWLNYSYYSFRPEFQRGDFTNVSFGVYSYLTFILPKNFSIMNQLNIYRWGSAEYLSNTQVSWGLRFTKKYLNNDLQIYLDISNILPPKNISSSYGGNYIYRSEAQYAFTSFKLGLYYKFGRLKQATQIQESSSGQSGRI